MLGLFRRYGFAAVVTAGLAVMGVLVVGKSMVSAVGDLQGEARAAPAGAKGPGGGAPAVTAVAIASHTFSDAIQALGTAQARESIVITPKAADTIRAIRFDSGDRVRRGQVLVEMSSVEQAASLAEERAANLAAQDQLRRVQELHRRGFASQAALDAAQASANAAAARMDASGSRASDRTLRAPFAGIVGLRTASPGQYMRPGDQIGTLDDISQIKLDFDVPETRIAQLARGVAITAHTAAYADRTFQGTIEQVDSRIDPATRTVRVRAILPNADETLRPGMLMTVEVRSNPREALAAPEIAILDQADGAYVYRVNAGENGQSVELVRIQGGQRSGGMVEILGGLNAGDVVVTEGLQLLRPGAPVRIGGAGDELRDRGGRASAGQRPRG